MKNKYFNLIAEYIKKENKMSISRHFLIVGLSVLFINILSCSKKTDYSGLYVHYRGTLKYYTLVIEKIEDRNIKVILEGVPLDDYKTREWSHSCSGPIAHNTLKCGKYRVDFSAGEDRVTVEYPGNENQVFISSKQDIEEDVKIYEENQRTKK